MMELDNKRSYLYRDLQENFWKVEHDKTKGMEGWYIWKKPPKTSRWLCLGMVTDSEAKTLITSQPPKLTSDDLIDLHIGIKRWLSE